VTGYVPDAELSRYLGAADICACLRWPTNRETSASWLRCLAAGRATIVSDLSHLTDVPTIDPRGWRVQDARARLDNDARAPIAVAVDLVDEQHSLQLAIDRLAREQPVRDGIASAARRWWRTHHQLDPMAEAYDAAIAEALVRHPPDVERPEHLLADGSRRLRALASSFGVERELRDVIDTGDR
jgi:hypothetical protein